jgi:predicted DNA-binding transcriptional regulator YafY
MSVSRMRGRHVRLLRMLSHLQSGDGFNVGELADQLNVGRRTVFRDLNVLREAGFDVQFDGTLDGYRLGDRRNLVVTPELDPEELTTLVAAAHLSVLRGLPECRDVLRRSTNKLLGGSPDRVRHDALRLTNSCVLRSPGERYSPDATRGVQDILQAIRQRRVLRVSFSARHEEGPIETRLAPYEMLATSEAWTVTGRSTHHNAVCSFDPGHFQRTEITEEIYAIPRGYRASI